MRVSAAVSFLLVPALVLVGGVAALAATSTDIEARRVASVAYDGALADAADARESALGSLVNYWALAEQSQAALESAAFLRAVGSEWLDAAVTAALVPMAARLSDSIPGPPPVAVPRPSAITSDEADVLALGAEDLTRWADDVRSGLASHAAKTAETRAALAALRTGIMAVAGSVASTGEGILGASGSASSGTKAALTAALERVAAHIEDGTDPTDDLDVYIDAAKAAQDSHAAAVAAAAAAAESATGSGGTGGGTGYGGFPRGSYEEAYYGCHEGRPTMVLPGGFPSDPFPCTFSGGGDGPSYTFYS